MEKAEKVQDVSQEKSLETPEVVQQSAESSNSKTDTVSEEETPSDTEETVVDTIVEPDESEVEEEVQEEAEVITQTEAIEVSEKETPSYTEEIMANKAVEPDESRVEEEVQEEAEVITQTEAIEVSEEDHANESEHEEEEEEEDELDLDHASKEEVLAKLKDVRNEEIIRKLDRVLKIAKPRYDELYEIGKNEALQKFVSEGNEADAFEYHGDEIDKEFFGLYGQLRSKRNKHYKELESQKESNLRRKEQLLEELRGIVDGEESADSINTVRSLQSEWKKVGPVPGVQNKNLWANYNALLDRYYDNRSIYFELKDLDRKKNMKLKEELCEKAEQLAKSDDIKAAVMQLNDLHEEYKHIGPVPKEDQETLWQRFKGASDAIYGRRKEYFDELKVVFEENLVKKNELISEVEAFTQFNSDRITEWNQKTKELLELQKKWEAIGGVPREKAKDTNKAFWNSFKGFFANKNKFFKELESHREENLKKKEELIAKAEELKESKDWNSTADKFKNLQSQWKEIGPVPEKVRNSTYKRFKTACDHFFNKRREENQEQFKSYEENLKLKNQVCDQLEKAGKSKELDLDEIYDLVDNYHSVGFVPKNAIKKSRNRFDEVKKIVLDHATLSDDDRMDLRNHIEMGHLKNSPGGEKKLNRKEHSIRRKISTLENDVATYKRNMEFFAQSATADKLKAEMLERIEKAEQEVDELKSQLSAISS